MHLLNEGYRWPPKPARAPKQTPQMLCKSCGVAFARDLTALLPLTSRWDSSVYRSRPTALPQQLGTCGKPSHFVENICNIASLRGIMICSCKQADR